MRLLYRSIVNLKYILGNPDNIEVHTGPIDDRNGIFDYNNEHYFLDYFDFFPHNIVMENSVYFLGFYDGHVHVIFWEQNGQFIAKKIEQDLSEWMLENKIAKYKKCS